MAATEKTYYNIKRLHLLFAVSALALVGVTVWMLAADHYRPWRVYQRTFRDRIEPGITQLRIEEELARESRHGEQEPSADRQHRLDRLKRTFEQQRPGLARRLLGLPIIDALARTQTPQQIWLPELTVDYNFRRVARFDRCITCHLGIASAEPELRPEQVLTVELATPDEQPKQQGQEQPAREPLELEPIYGFTLAEQGILDPQSPTVSVVLPESRAADAGLQTGDVILEINDAEVTNTADVRRHLLHKVEWGQPLELSIRRGLAQPYCSHPRGDLYVGSASPHPMEEFGCTICHDGQGSATDFAFASHTPNDVKERSQWQQQHGWARNHHWDFPMLPDRFAQSRCLRCHHEVTDLEPSRRFPHPPAERLLAGYNLIRRSGCFGCHEIKGVTHTGLSIGPDMRLEPDYSEAARTPAGAEPYPGTMRKIGINLRDTGAQLSRDFLIDRIANPTNFLPEARMPQLFGRHEHLDAETAAEAKRFEAVEIRGVVEYLLSAAQPVEPLPAQAGVTEAPSAQRGKRLFAMHGCLACHKHQAFPKGEATQGPELSKMGAKFTTEPGAKWLASWIRDPVRHAPRTLMPNPLLEPVPLEAAAEGEEHAGGESPRITDPAADIAAFLLESKSPYTQEQLPSVAETAPALDELVLLHLCKMFPGEQAQKYLAEGIPQSMAGEVSPDVAVLLAPVSTQKKLLYVGRRAIRRLGCYGCHDIPGFAGAQPVGPALSEWGRKRESLLGFEQIGEYLRQSGELERAAEDADRGFFAAALLAHRREGFLWQKLRAPRSFEHRIAGDRPYPQRLAMGKFNFSEEQIEAIATFVLGLVADPPAEQYVYRPDAPGKAIVEGRKILEKYACAECHTLEMERWTFKFDPEMFFDPPEMPEWDFLRSEAAPEAIAASLETDNRGLRHGEVVGRARVDGKGRLLEDEDDDGNPLYFFMPWQPAAINGRLWPPGGAEVMISQPQITGKRPPLGGAFARLLYPIALADARSSGSGASEREAWGWVPPPLVGEGAKVRPAWLHDYLLQPAVIRPACVLRMPQYNMSSAEAGKLVDYFAAVSGVEFPYDAPPRGQATELDRLDDAMKLLVDNKTYCAKCHLIGDAGPGGKIRTVLAPKLDQVGRRLRGEYLRRWLANPKSILPYTAMPVNFPPSGEPLDRTLFDGSSREQFDAVTELLREYDAYLKTRTSVRELVEPAAEE